MNGVRIAGLCNVIINSTLPMFIGLNMIFF